MSRPSFDLEHSIDGSVCGLDEVGRGPLAGPVVAACVFIPEEAYELEFVPEIRDSKKLSEKKLLRLHDLIAEHFHFSVCELSPKKIDEINILQASLLAMKTSLQKLDKPMDHALVDGNRCPADLPCASTPVIKGDGISVSIAAASIMAKVTRDRIMQQLAETHPHYGWERNVGYPTKEHLEAIDAHGITPHHRRSFGPVKNFLEFGQVKKQA